MHVWDYRLSFDSILVRLKVNYRFHIHQLLQRFDSILVRLKVVDSISKRLFSEMFRFHTGSIKRQA